MKKPSVASRFIVTVLAGILLACICPGAHSQTAQNPGLLHVEEEQQHLNFSATTKLANQNLECNLRIAETGSTILPIPLDCFVDTGGGLSASIPISSIPGVTAGTLRVNLGVLPASGSELHFSGTVRLTQEDIPAEAKRPPLSSLLTVTVTDKTLSLSAYPDLQDGPYTAQANLSQETGSSASPIELPVSCTVNHGKLTAEIPLDSIASRLIPGNLTVDLVFPAGLRSAPQLRGTTELFESDVRSEMQPEQESPAWYSLSSLLSSLRPHAGLFALVVGVILLAVILAYSLPELLRKADTQEKHRSDKQFFYASVDIQPATPTTTPPPEGSTPGTPSQPADNPPVPTIDPPVASAPASTSPPAPKSIAEQLKDAQAQLNPLEARLTKIETNHESLCGELDKLTYLSDVIYPWIQHDGTAGDEATRGVQFALAATVNHWIKSRTRNRIDLIALAQQAGIANAKLANLQDTDQSSKGMTRFRDAEDGTWLWTPIPGTDDSWAAPVDAQLMAMGKAPSQLAEMFDGMENAQHGLQFEEIFRPCRLQRLKQDGSDYKLVERGALKLQGNQAPPGPKAQLFETYAEIARLGRVDGLPIGRLSGLLEAWMWRIEAKLSRFGSQIGRIQQNSTAPSAANTNPTNDDLLKVKASLERELKGLKNSFAEKLQQIEESLTALKAVRVSPPIPAPAPAPAQTPAPVYQARHPLPVASYVPQSSAARMESAPPILFSQAAQDLESRKTPVAGMTPALQGKWHEAYMRALMNPASKPEITGIPSPELYIERARNLRDSLKSADRSTQVSLVHVKKDPSSNTVEIHSTDENAMGEIVCSVCSEKHTWQIAVVFGAPGSTEAYLLFPGGALAKSNFPAGYSALIEDIPSSMFFMQATRPALLGLQDASRSTYVLLQKMTLDSSGGGKS